MSAWIPEELLRILREAPALRQAVFGKPDFVFPKLRLARVAPVRCWMLTRCQAEDSEKSASERHGLTRLRVGIIAVGAGEHFGHGVPREAFGQEVEL